MTRTGAGCGTRWLASIVLAASMGCGPIVGTGGDTGPEGSSSTTGTVPAPMSSGSAPPDPSAPSPDPVPSTSTSTTGTTAGDDGYADEGFLPDYTDGGNIECSTWAQDCPLGEKCMPWANDGGAVRNATKCSPVDPNPAGIGEACMIEGSPVSGVDDCELGTMCWDFDPESLEGTCIALCAGNESDPQCPGACQSCAISGDGVLNLCVDSCDPLAQDCGDGLGCYPFNDTFWCAPDAFDPPKTGACEYINACPPGQACVDATSVPDCEGNGCCAPFCSTALSDTCDSLLPGTVCTPWYEAKPPNDCIPSSVGVCVLP